MEGILRMTTLNARVGAAALVAGSGGTVLLKLVPTGLVPMLVLALGLSALGAWAFADEMGLRKPLNRAGLVAFAFAAMAKAMVLLQQPGSGQRFLVLYLFSLLLALLLWSLALLHRDGSLKLAGALGAAGAVLPVLMLVAGHIFLGAGAIWGISALDGAATAQPQASPAIVGIIDAIFLAWSLLAAAALWSGKIEPSAT